MPPQLFLVWWTLLGLMVGSFLNVAIHRLPLEGEGVSKPRRSRCPHCRHELSWRENLPLVSWLLQGGRCRWCRGPISWRYPLVEALTAVLWFGAAWLLRDGWGAEEASLSSYLLLLVHVTVLSGLVVSTFVDFAHFEIPDEVSLGGLALAPLATLLVPALHDETWLAQRLTEGWGPGEPVDRVAALTACAGGAFVGWLVLWGIGRLGKAIYGREAMGMGDVKLMAAAGGFLGPGGVLVALMLASVVASVAGLGNVVRFTCLSQARARERGGRKSLGRSFQIGRIAGRYLPFGPYLGIGIGIVLLAWKDVAGLWG